MKKGYLFILYFFSILLFSCINPEKEELKNTLQEVIGKEVVFPKDLKYVSEKDSCLTPLFKKLKIIVYINGECISCMSKFELWKDKASKFIISDDLEILFYVKTLDYESVKAYIEAIDFKYPFFIDSKADILFLNGISEKQTMLHTFLLDKDNKIVLVGSPLGNEKMTQLYKKEIARLSAEK